MSIPDPIVLLDARARYVHPAFEMSRASTKTVFDAAGRLVTVPVNGIGWDHDPATGQARGYLAEPSATNLLLHSNDLTQGVWVTANTSVTPDAITGPDGAGMAKLVENDQNGIHNIRQTSTINDGQTVVFSFVAKAGERTRLMAFVMDEQSQSDRAFVSVNLDDGQVDSQGAAGDATHVDSGVIDIGGGCYRVWLSGTIGEGATQARGEVRLRDAQSSNYQGDGTSGLYLGYCQVEVGSHPTSYIPTAGSTVTRAGDSLVLSGLGNFQWWAGERGTVFIEYQLFGTRGAGHFFEISNSQIEVRFNAGGTGVICSGAAVESAVLIQPEQARIFTRKKHAFTFDAEEYASVWNGGGLVSGARSAPFTYPAGLMLASSPPIPGHIMRAVYYPARLSNADLQSLTAIQE